MTARDILLAPSDKVLNEFAGLKKFATFREEEKKRKDRKHLGKKARLRQWRRDVFGQDYERTGPTFGFEKYVEEEEDGAEQLPYGHKRRQNKHDKTRDAEMSNVIEADEAAGGAGARTSGKKKRKRSNGKKSEA
ncbi:hypothetical protein NQ176_g9782 [Zarea fungicola]|uniref:Uncharacterized protein n=1 Tax=Zarea fungicola TaxID=93591 RepID=A0ACC1MKX4_9HYPO|nr:hypothetical protein NQ176_g9782 [Lecanicillium fungicola]